jgi:hypothetical protein
MITFFHKEEQYICFYEQNKNGVYSEIESENMPLSEFMEGILMRIEAVDVLEHKALIVMAGVNEEEEPLLVVINLNDPSTEPKALQNLSPFGVTEIGVVKFLDKKGRLAVGCDNGIMIVLLTKKGFNFLYFFQNLHTGIFAIDLRDGE